MDGVEGLKAVARTGVIGSRGEKGDGGAARLEDLKGAGLMVNGRGISVIYG